MLDSKGHLLVLLSREVEERRNVLRGATMNPSNSYLRMLILFLDFGEIGKDRCRV